MGKMSYETLRDQYNKVLKKLKEDRAKVEDVEEMLARKDKEQAQAVAKAIAETEARVNAEWSAKLTTIQTNAENAIAEVDQEIGSLSGKLLTAEGSIKRLNWQTNELVENVKNLTMSLALMKEERDMWKEKANGSQPTIDLLSSQVRDLRELFNKFRSQMRRKDAEKESAILNRQAVATAVPSVNYRR